MRGRDWRTARRNDAEIHRAHVLAEDPDADVEEEHPGQEGWIYILHFARPFKHAAHYIGWTKHDDPRIRIEEHRSGKGARLTRAAVADGIELHVADLGRGTKRDEGKLKDRGGARRVCPVCKGVNGPCGWNEKEIAMIVKTVNRAKGIV